MSQLFKSTFVLLAVALVSLASMPPAQALRPKPDFFVHVVNASGAAITLCTADLKRCEAVQPGAMAADAQATGTAAIVSIAPWIAATVVKLCGKTIPLDKLVGAPVAVKSGNTVTYTLTISTGRYLRQCAGAPAAGRLQMAA